MRFCDLSRSIALLCCAFALGCTSAPVSVVPTEVNLDIVHPDGSSTDLGFTIDRIDYRVTCSGTPPGGAPIPPADTAGAPVAFDDSVDISGSFEIVDTRIPPVWQAVMALPPGSCTMTMSVWDEDEIVCIGSQTLVIVEDDSAQFDIIMVCSLSVDLPDGVLNVDGSFEFVVGNLCPRLFSMMAIPSTVDIDAIPPRTRVEYRSVDPDGTCGNNCQPQTCTTDVPPVCSPSAYNPADPRCNPSFGGDPSSPECQDGSAAGLVCTLTATPTATATPGGSFVSPYDGVLLVGPSLAINLDDFGLDGTGVAVPGVDVVYECDPSIPGSVTMDLVCGDGDPMCDRNETITVICPGQNFCDSDPIDCSAPSECTADGLCDAFCDPATTCERCPGQGDPLPAGTGCASGGNVCDGAGNCVECLDSSLCDSSPIDCLEPSQCVGNVCQPRALSPVGTPCSNGECDAAGVCQFVPIDPAAQTRSITLGCTNSVTSSVAIIPFDLTVDPTAIVSGQSTTALVDGVARLSEKTLDAVALTVPGGVTQIELVDLQTTVHLRSGGAGPDLTLTAEAVGSFIDLPISTDCAPGGVCAGLNKLASQCSANGFCVTGALPLALQAASASYTADASGEMRFGWDDAGTGASLDVDGTWALPPAIFADPVGSIGMRVRAGGLSIAVECTMAVDSADPLHGVGIPGKSSPTPDALLVSFPIQVP